MKIVYTHENRILVENARNLLSQNGIKSLLKNEFASGGMGELSPISTWPELWVVDEQDYGKAKALIAQLAEDSHQKEWKCQVCQEINDSSFDLCWNCQNEKA